MTTPSETRAGKLPELPSSLLLVEVHDDEYGHVRRTADDDYYTADQMRAYATEALAASEPGEAEPVPMILHCPRCHVQHVDEPDERTPDWANPPHRSHLCHGCGYIWRPADVATVGVAAIKTKGKADSPAPEQPGKGEAESDRFFIEHGMVHDRKTGKHLVSPDSAGEATETLLSVLRSLEADAWAWKQTFLTYSSLNKATPQPSDPAEGESIEQLAARLKQECVAYRAGFAAGKQAALSTPPTAAVRVPRVNYGFALGALDRIAYYFEGSRGGTEDIATIRAALIAALDPQVKR